MPEAALTRFDRDTAVQALGDGRFAATIDRGWWVQRGPHGGYVAAIVLRALTEALDDPARAPRSLTVHFTAPPAEGPVELVVRVERSGRSLTTLSARMTQGERLVALALAAFAKPYPSAIEYAEPPPPARPFEEARSDFGVSGDARLHRPPGPASRARRPALQRRLGGAHRPAGCAWTSPNRSTRSRSPFCTDAWWPAVFPRLSAPALAPTIDLTVHFRATLPVSSEPHDFLLGVFRSRAVREGFVEEDGELWTRDGVLIAQSRQLALLIPAG